MDAAVMKRTIAITQFGSLYARDQNRVNWDRMIPVCTPWMNVEITAGPSISVRCIKNAEESASTVVDSMAWGQMDARLAG
jgi:hypothetical protein